MESRRRLEDRARRLAVRNEVLVAERDAAKGDATACAHALEDVAGELSRMKDIVALHIVAAGHRSTVLHDPKRMGEALREELAANWVDLRLELARLEGATL